MSKDHGGTGSHHGSKGSTNLASDKAKDHHARDQKGASKKSSASSSTVPDMHPLPTLKEEKKQQSSNKSSTKKMEAKGKENVPAPVPATRTLVPDLAHPDLSPTSPTSTSSSSTETFPEKAQLEKTVSDLVKNAESKKQEIAALKMEINRLKVGASPCFGAVTVRYFCRHYGTQCVM